MKPLGYWLVHIHELMESNFECLLADDALTRRHWQVLNTISAKPGGLAGIEQALAHFHDDVRPLIRDFADRGWVTPDYELTAAGRAAYERIAARVHAERAKVLDGVSPEQYATLMRVLERIATNAAAHGSPEIAAQGA